MEQSKDFLATRPIGRLLLQLSLPTVAAQLINMLYNVVDRIYIGHIPGEGALALTGVGVCMPLILIISAFAALVGNGGAPRASIALGKKQTAEAEQILGNCFVTQLLVSAVLTAVVLIWNRPLLLAFGASSNTIDYSAAYMNLYALGTVFVQLTLGYRAVPGTVLPVGAVFFIWQKDFYPHSPVQSASARQGHSPLSGAGQRPVRHAGQRERDLRML